MAPARRRLQLWRRLGTRARGPRAPASRAASTSAPGGEGAGGGCGPKPRPGPPPAPTPAAPRPAPPGPRLPCPHAGGTRLAQGAPSLAPSASQASAVGAGPGPGPPRPPPPPPPPPASPSSPRLASGAGERESPSARAGPRVAVSGGTWVQSSAPLFPGPGTIVPELGFPSRREKDEREGERPRPPPLGKRKGAGTARGILGTRGVLGARGPPFAHLTPSRSPEFRLPCSL